MTLPAEATAIVEAGLRALIQPPLILTPRTFRREAEAIVARLDALQPRPDPEPNRSNLDEVTIDRLVDENWRLRQIEKAAQAVCDRTGNIAALRLALDGQHGGRKPTHPPNPEVIS